MEAPKQALVWVAGGRDYQNQPRAHYVLDEYHRLHGIRCIITGACRTGQTPIQWINGADGLAESWARKNEIAYIGVPAKWESEGKGAGPKRNEIIASVWKPDVLLAFPGGSGTDDAIEAAERHNILVFRIADAVPKIIKPW